MAKSPPHSVNRERGKSERASAVRDVCPMKKAPLKTQGGLYNPQATHSSCGVGVLVDLKGTKSHQLVEDGFQILFNLEHRGARGAEEKTGDGAGMLLQKPHQFFQAEIPELGSFDDYGVGQAFFPRDRRTQEELRQLLERVAGQEGLELFAWRDVPTNNSALGKTAKESEPAVKQFFVKPIVPLAPDQFDSQLYIGRRAMEKAAAQGGLNAKSSFYICSLDRRKIVYKGLLTGQQLKLYYPDLSERLFSSSLVLVHLRFSTNTLGAWHLAHPYRSIIHNGEFNTLQGNRNWMKTREADLVCPKFGDDIQKIKPVVTGSSDSAVFDNVLELLLEAGRDLPQALRMMIPEAWNQDPLMNERRREFYDYMGTLMEPWDGPALIVATDGYRVAAVLDRNGLRPCRYSLTQDGRLIMGSETGILEVPASQVVLKGRLQPGQLFLADPLQGRIVPEEEIFEGLTSKRYGAWLRSQRLQLKDLVAESETEPEPWGDGPTITQYQQAFGYTLESVRCLVEPMAETGRDPIGAMGNDAPLAALSARPQTIFQYFRQLFAQVSNPPIDYLRERLVTSLESHIGRQHNLLAESPEHCRQLKLDSPLLTARELAAIRGLDLNGIRAGVVESTYPLGTKLEAALAQIRQQAVQVLRDGCEIIVLSDRSVSPQRLAVPSLLAIGAVHHHLSHEGLRSRVGLVLESGEPHTVHHFCTLIGYGADAIHPWLAERTVARLVADGFLPEPTQTALAQYKKAVEGGLLKVMSKMGISTLESYKGAQVFETIGLNPDLVAEYFTGTTARIPGLELEDLERELQERHELAFGQPLAGNLPLTVGGEFYWRRDGELHQWNPLTISQLQQAVRTGDYEVYKKFAAYINEQSERLQTLRGLLDFRTEPSAAIPLEQVEPPEEIIKRFSTGSMSFGALSREAHETLALAMNRLGGKSGTGEGGEQVERFGTERECTMKQVASGRFGVTIHYLCQAQQIEIKMAQGSKPGEGGELPGRKVNEEIAAVRFTTPGVGLISPPPHHDIYSIEDLAQLIYDLKCANPIAELHVKLVACRGVGTIAAGVAKARADAVLIGGSSGGTGASLKTSIKSAGAPWELGLAETHQVLLANNLRSRIRVRTDGGAQNGTRCGHGCFTGGRRVRLWHRSPGDCGLHHAAQVSLQYLLGRSRYPRPRTAPTVRGAAGTRHQLHVFSGSGN